MFNLARNVGTAAITSLLFSLIGSMLLIKDSGELGFYLLVSLMFGAPPIFVIGIPSAFLIDKLVARLKLLYKAALISANVFLYAAAGFIGAIMYFAVLAGRRGAEFNVQEAVQFSIIGALAALLFLGVKYLVKLLT